MAFAPLSTRLELTEEEAYSLLMLALTSTQKLDKTSEGAVRKLAAFCKTNTCHHPSHLSTGELNEAG